VKTGPTSLALSVLTATLLTGCSALPFVDPFETLEVDGVSLVVEKMAPTGVQDILHTGPVVVTNGCVGIEVFGGEESSWVSGDVEATGTPLMLPMVAPKGTTLSRNGDAFLITTEDGDAYRDGEVASFSSATRIAEPGDTEGDIVEAAVAPALISTSRSGEPPRLGPADRGLCLCGRHRCPRVNGSPREFSRHIYSAEPTHPYL